MIYISCITIIFSLLGILSILHSVYSLIKGKFRSNVAFGFRIIDRNKDRSIFLYSVIMDFIIGIILIGLGLLLVCQYQY